VDNADYITVTTPAGTTTQAIRDAFPPPEPNPSDAGMPGPAEVDPDADIERALSYVQQVKNRYANDPEKYKAFLEILSPGEIAGVRQPIVVSSVVY
jgi:paired amphipathic helix protein Sin3a